MGKGPHGRPNTYHVGSVGPHILDVQGPSCVRAPPVEAVSLFAKKFLAKPTPTIATPFTFTNGWHPPPAVFIAGGKFGAVKSAWGPSSSSAQPAWPPGSESLFRINTPMHHTMPNLLLESLEDIPRKRARPNSFETQQLINLDSQRETHRPARRAFHLLEGSKSEAAAAILESLSWYKHEESHNPLLQSAGLGIPGSQGEDKDPDRESIIGRILSAFKSTNLG